MINEIYLPLHEAAEITKSSIRALLQHGAENGLPIYAQVENYGYYNILECDINSEGIDINQKILGDNNFPEFFENPLNGRFQVQKECLDACARDPENALIFLEYRRFDSKDKPNACIKRYIFCGLNFYFKNASLEVMVSDLRDAGLLPNTNLRNMTEFVDDPRWTDELDIAVMAWRAASSTLSLEDRPREFIEKWLLDNRPDLSKEQVLRITTITNWNKSPGRKLTTTS